MVKRIVQAVRDAMGTKSYVQHISGQGQKWEVDSVCGTGEYRVYAKDKTVTNYHYLPPSEFIPCDPPEEWEDVTAQCEIGHAEPERGRMSIIYKDAIGVGTDIFNKYQLANYRVTKIDHLHNGPAFIIERQKS